MSRVNEAHNLISAAIDPVMALLKKDKKRSRSRSRGRIGRSRGGRRSRSRSKSRRHRRSRSRHRRSRSRSSGRRRRSRSRSRSRKRARRYIILLLWKFRLLNFAIFIGRNLGIVNGLVHVIARDLGPSDPDPGQSPLDLTGMMKRKKTGKTKIAGIKRIEVKAGSGTRKPGTAAAHLTGEKIIKRTMTGIRR